MNGYLDLKPVEQHLASFTAQWRALREEVTTLNSGWVDHPDRHLTVGGWSIVPVRYFGADDRPASLSAPAVKRRVDRLREQGVLQGFKAVVNHAALGPNLEAVIELFYAPGIQIDHVRASLRPHPEVVEAWSVTGDADCMVRVRVRDPADLERVIMELQRQASVVRTRSQFVMSHLIERRD